MLAHLRQLLCTLYQMVFIDAKTGVPSHTKFWSNVGYASMCFTFVYAVINGTTTDVMIWALFGIVVIGNRTVVKLFSAARNKEDADEREKHSTED